MSRTDVIPQAQFNAVVDSLKGFFPAPPNVAGSGPGLGTPIGMSESFQVWTVPLGRFRASLLDEATWNGVWHHQIGAGPGDSQSYARSLGGAEETVRAVYWSPLAAELDQAIEAIDKDPRFASDQYIARLLTIPELDLTAVWMAGSPSYLIPLGQFARPDSQHFEPMTAEQLGDYLGDRKAIIGLGPAT